MAYLKKKKKKIFTLILLELKVISFCHQYIRAFWLGSILLADQFLSFHLDIPKKKKKTEMGSTKKWKVDYTI